MKIRTALGQSLDVGTIMRAEQEKVALGNAGLNARGDEVTTRGHILRRREKIMQDYYVNNPKAVKQVPLHGVRPDRILTPEETVRMLDRFQTPGQPLRTPTVEEMQPVVEEMEIDESHSPELPPAGFEEAKSRRRKVVEKD